MAALIINEKNHRKEIENCKNPVLLSFGSDGLASFLLRQAFNALSEELQGEIKVAVASANKKCKLAKKYNVRLLPTTVLIQHGKVTDTIVGNMSREGLLNVLQTSSFK
jgi:thioredoxin-like negative regulator of GroEL